jgi:type IV pilus assembly protein PilV
MNPHHIKPANNSSGFSLIEVLITVVVLSIGLLGLASLQANSMQMNREAFMRTQAILLAYDMADRMRANMVAVASNDYHLPGSGSAVGACKSKGAVCTPAQMAQNDAYEWSQTLARHLPSGEGVVCRDADPTDGTSASSPGCDGGANSLYAIKIWWDRNRDGNLDSDPLYISFQP